MRHHSSMSTPTYNRSHYSGSSEPSPSTTNQRPFPATAPLALPPVNYHLSIRQQPVAARACGFGERDRRVIDPPPILEVKTTDKITGEVIHEDGVMMALHCSLLSHDYSDETEVPSTQEGQAATRRMMGTLVASPYTAKDDHGISGNFYVFPDLSCRSPGKFRLRFKLIRVEFATMRPGGTSPTVASCDSDIFSVYTAKDFPGMRASSGLLKALRRQGLNVGVKKGSDARKGSKKAKKEESASEDDEESDDDADEGERRSNASEDTGSNDRAHSKKGKRRKMAAR